MAEQRRSIPIARRLGDLLGFCLILGTSIPVVLFGLLAAPILIWKLAAVALVPTPPPLLQGLDSAKTAPSKEFDKRIQERFPIGTPVTELTEELRRQGFSPVANGAPARDGYRSMSRPVEVPLCNVTASVGWTADEADRVATLAGTVWFVCL